MKILRDLYLGNRLFLLIGSRCGCFPHRVCVWRCDISSLKFIFFLLVASLLTDLILLFRVKRGLRGERLLADRLSNGDENEISIYLESFYTFPNFASRVR
jgi:hypothetical protein